MDKENFNFLEKLIDKYFQTNNIELKIVFLGIIFLVFNIYFDKLVLTIIGFIIIFVGLISNLILSFLVKISFAKLQIVQLYSLKQFKAILPRKQNKTKRIYIYQVMGNLAEKEIKKLCNNIKKKIKIVNRYKRYISLIEFYGISYIPLLFYSGYLMKYLDCQVYEHYQNRGNENEWNALSESTNTCNEMRVIESNYYEDETEMLLLIGVTVSVDIIKKNNLNNIYDGRNLISLQVDYPKHDALSTKGQLKQYIDKFRKVVTEVSNVKNINKLHIVYAGPASLAFHLGSVLKLETQDVKNTYIYHYIREDGYVWGLNLSNEKINIITN